MGLFTMFGPSSSTTSSDNGKETRTCQYENGNLVNITDTNNETGETHHHEVTRGWFGPGAGAEKK